MAAEDYIVKTTQDAMIRQKAIKDKLEEYGLSPRQEDLDAVNQVLETISNDDTISLGFSKDTYSPHVYGFYCNEKASCSTACTIRAASGKSATTTSVPILRKTT